MIKGGRGHNREGMGCIRVVNQCSSFQTRTEKLVLIEAIAPHSFPQLHSRGSVVDLPTTVSPLLEHVRQ